MPREAPLRAASSATTSSWSSSIDLPAQTCPKSIPEPPSSGPFPSWFRANVSSTGIKTPITIAHRGNCIALAENTLPAFTSALEHDADALETDIHLTQDQTVVLSHDASLKRCFGQDLNIIDAPWSTIAPLRTLKAPHAPMPRLLDLLDLIATRAAAGLESRPVWILLDIKLDNFPDLLLAAVARTLAAAPDITPSWEQRVVLGCWSRTYFPLCAELLPLFPVSHVGFSTVYAAQFLPAQTGVWARLRGYATGIKRKHGQIQCKVNESNTSPVLNNTTANPITPDTKSQAGSNVQRFDSTSSSKPRSPNDITSGEKEGLKEIAFDFFLPTLQNPFRGTAFLHRAQKAQRPVWAFNASGGECAARMKWACQHGLDGVIVDDVLAFETVKRRWILEIGQPLTLRRTGLPDLDLDLDLDQDSDPDQKSSTELEHSKSRASRSVVAAQKDGQLPAKLDCRYSWRDWWMTLYFWCLIFWVETIFGSGRLRKLDAAGLRRSTVQQ